MTFLHSVGVFLCDSSMFLAVVSDLDRVDSHHSAVRSGNDQVGESEMTHVSKDAPAARDKMGGGDELSPSAITQMFCCHV
jgi:hypothetical protein